MVAGTSATDMDSKVAMEIGYVSCGSYVARQMRVVRRVGLHRSMSHSCRNFLDFHTLIKTSDMGPDKLLAGRGNRVRTGAISTFAILWMGSGTVAKGTARSL